MDRVYNFNAGPSAMPLEVLQEAQAEFLNYKNTGMSIIEMSHRSRNTPPCTRKPKRFCAS